MNPRRILTVGLVMIATLLLMVSPALAAQGQITEVNPSGLKVANNATNGHVRDVISNTPAGEFVIGDFSTDVSIGGTAP